MNRIPLVSFKLQSIDVGPKVRLGPTLSESQAKFQGVMRGQGNSMLLFASIGANIACDIYYSRWT